MLVNAKPEELVKYSKGTYEKDRFISNISSLWEWTDKQIRMIYLTADLAINGQGVFSVSNNSFREMFQNRFKMTISRSTVIRFFQLLEELTVLTVNEGRRKNRTQSANIFIIEPLDIPNETPDEIPDETPNDTPHETLNETPIDTHNIAFNKAFNEDFNKTLTKPLTNNVVNNLVNKDDEKNIDNLSLKHKSNGQNQEQCDDDVIHMLTNEYRLKGLCKEVCLRVVNEVMQVRETIQNFGGYLRTCLSNTLYRSKVKHGEINPYDRIKQERQYSNVPFYDWLNTEEEDSSDEHSCNVLLFQDMVL